MKSTLLLSFVFSGLIATALASEMEPQKVTIEDLRENLERNDFELLASELGLRSTEHNYYASLGAFDPTFSQGLTEHHDRDLNAVTSTLFLAGREHQRNITRTSTTSLSKVWGWGTTTTLGYTATHQKAKRSTGSLHPTRESQWSFDITQPLLKGAGPESALSTVRSRRESWESAVQSHKRLRLERMLDLEIAYWGWILDREREAVLRRSVKRSEDILEYNRSAFDAGTFARTEVLEAETQLLEAQADELAANQSTLDRADDLRLIAGWETLSAAITSDETLPKVQAAVLAEQSVLVERAHHHRQDLKALVHQISSLGHSLRKSDRDQLPDLDLELSFDWDGTERNHGNSFDKSLSGSDWDWRVGLDFSYPLGNRSARNNYLSAKFSKMRIEKQMAELRARIVLEVRQNKRAVETQLKIVETRRKALESALASLDAETQKHRLGRISTLTLAQVQERADDAELALLTARRDMWIAVARLRVTLGAAPTETLERP